MPPTFVAAVLVNAKKTDIDLKKNGICLTCLAQTDPCSGSLGRPATAATASLMS
jgi:hypothetical protein